MNQMMQFVFHSSPELTTADLSSLPMNIISPIQMCVFAMHVYLCEHTPPGCGCGLCY